MRENQLKWFGHIQRKRISVPIKKNCGMIINGAMGTGRRPSQTWMEATKKGMALLHFMKMMALIRANWKEKIHAANPKSLG